jgi:hypothetical protein
MQKLNAKDYHWAIGQLRSIQNAADREKAAQSRKARISDKHASAVQKLGNALIPQLEILRAPGSMQLAKLLIQAKDSGKLTYDSLSQRAKAIDEILRTELSDAYIFALGVKADYFEPNEPLFGQVVSLQFPSVIDEISEAGKCYSLGRSTASAFHSIRCLEAGIRALSRCLAIPDPTRGQERSWGAMLTQIKREIDRRWIPGSNARLSGDGEFFDNAYAALAAMQNPWRNATMHLDQKYTEEEAKHVLDVVKGFMRILASRMDENGLPIA